jgi:hypothetical protein
LFIASCIAQAIATLDAHVTEFTFWAAITLEIMEFSTEVRLECVKAEETTILEITHDETVICASIGFAIHHNLDSA